MKNEPRMMDDDQRWPELPALDDWRETFDTLHRWSQIVGKIRLECAPQINHSWGSTLYVTTRGLSTSPIPYGSRTFSIDFDFLSHDLKVTVSDGARGEFALEPMSVAHFYRHLMRVLERLDIDVAIYPLPVEIPDPIEPFPEDERHAAYDAGTVQRFWRVLVQVERVFTDFRSRFIGKVSPVHFFWGAFDLAVTRFSGRPAPAHPGGVPNCPDRVMIEAYSQEVSSAGFWPGAGLGEAAFYAYSYPEPEGFNAYTIAPDSAYFHEEMGEFVLPYEKVRTSDNPDEALLAFLQSTYEAAANLAAWDRDALEVE